MGVEHAWWITLYIPFICIYNLNHRYVCLTKYVYIFYKHYKIIIKICFYEIRVQWYN